jgi:UDP-N-acetylglucosamine 3-dehydrogenase
MKIGVLGSGFMGGTHARALAKVDGVQVAAVSSRSIDKAQALAGEVGASATTDDMAIITDPSIDTVSITLPTHLHAEYTTAALKAGKHVLLEKPFALTEAECDEMIAAHQGSDQIFMIAHVLRFWPAYVELVKYVHSGKLGKPLAAMASRLSVMPGWADWFKDPKLSGGAVMDLMIHDVDALNWALGEPKSVYARGHEAAPGLWNHVMTIVDYGGAHGFIEASEFMPKDYPFTAMMKVVCEKGTVEFNFRAGGVSVEMGGVNTLVVYEAGNAFNLGNESSDPYQNQINYFVNCVRSGEQPELGTPEQARLGIKVANAARKSLETGTIITL